MSDLKEAILKPRPRRVQKVHVPEWDVDVYVHAMTSAEKEAWEDTITDKKGRVRKKNLRADLAVEVMRDANGDRIFERDDVDDLAEQPASALSRIYDVAMKLNGVTEEDVEDIEEN
ncbi:MAG: hypothetical protein AAF916_04170 [Planctomycetota bacterium]